MRRSVILVLIALVFFFAVYPAQAATANTAQSLFELIGSFYDYSLKIVGLCVFVMFLWAGLQMILPGGSWATAQKIILDAIIGLVLLLSASVILNSINPDLTKETRSIPVIPSH